MKIIITACGIGSRFQKEGIKIPKYQIIAKNKPLFYWALISLKKFFKHEFILIFNKQNYDEKFVKDWLKNMKIINFKIIVLPKTTDGQATTVMKCKKFLKNNDSILIYNVDTHIDPCCLSPKFLKYDGNISVALAKGDHWSFVKLNKNGFATNTSEKIRISKYASLGYYFFKNWRDFKKIYNNHKKEIISKYKEAYIAPMYQYLIDDGGKVDICLLKMSSIISLGTPKEVLKFDKNFIKNNTNQ